MMTPQQRRNAEQQQPRARTVVTQNAGQEKTSATDGRELMCVSLTIFFQLSFFNHEILGTAMLRNSVFCRCIFTKASCEYL